MFLLSVLVCCAFIDGSRLFFFFKQKTAYEMRISDWSSDVCSSDLLSAAATAGWRAHTSLSQAVIPDGCHTTHPNCHCRACPGNPCPKQAPDLSGEARCRGRMGPLDKPEGDDGSGWLRWGNGRKRYVNAGGRWLQKEDLRETGREHGRG